jgi:hypothetical protein
MNNVRTGTATIRIAGESRSLEDADSRWVVQRVDGLRRSGQLVCVEVLIRSEEVRMTLTSPGCGSNGAGGGRLPNTREQEIFNLWDQMRLNQRDFNGGHVNAFLQRLRNLLS